MSGGIFNRQTGYHNCRSIHLPGYDYSQPGYYFVTICVHDRKLPLFGDIVENTIIMNDFGAIVQNEILKTEQMRPNIKIDEYIIMPNHCHMIYQIRGNDFCRGTLQRAPAMDQRDPKPLLQNARFPERTNHKSQIERFGKPTSNSIPTIVRLTKSTITKQINISRDTPGAEVWQHNYYEHIIRNDKSFFHIKKYIRESPLNWEHDIENHIDFEIDKFEMIEIKL